ncbi:uncharacterized protein F5891DRAFT_162576 [Suillus fuscotomentosus]|uniref:Uncharacterized protein n=1 Tax=Suillus fuscotomentosus TaxID=1912939 RepID=A0AAD4EAL1_9AGAM|nr:uncharacterized protein F5891DRAFT_162576 [Suillus fuscotomentosus]KAG1902432.1 hypothetical protein F5891DRAFT_162576 [Suillus fuscotomentosus]
MTLKSSYVTFQPTSLLALDLKRSLVPINLIHAMLVCSTYVDPPFPSSAPHFYSLQSDATPRPARHKPVIIPAMSPIPRPLPAKDPHARLRFLRKLFSRTDAGRIDEPYLLDFPATSPLPCPLPKHDENSRRTPAPPTTQSSVINTSPTFRSNRLSSCLFLRLVIGHLVRRYCNCCSLYVLSSLHSCRIHGRYCPLKRLRYDHSANGRFCPDSSVYGAPRYCPCVSICHEHLLSRLQSLLTSDIAGLR